VIRRRVSDAAEQMRISNLLGRNIFNLSGGEKQKIACAGVYAMEPEIYVLDEPTSNLDADAILKLREILLLLKKEGRTILIAEHRLDWLEGICDRAVLLGAGKKAKEYDAADFFAMDGKERNSLGLRGGAFPAPGIGKDAPGWEDITAGFRVAEKSCGREILLSGFTYCYGKRKALDIPSLTVPENAVIAVAGHNGAGKSTFAGCLCGLKKGFRGRVAFQGKEYAGKKLRRLSYMVMQDVNHQLFSESVLEEVMLGMAEEMEAKHSMEEEHSMKCFASMEEAAFRILERLDLLALKDRHPMSLSGGQKQRVAIASACASDRPILVMDEPTSGLDFKRMEETAELIQMMAKTKTVFVVTHDGELVRRCADYVLCLENGKVRALLGKGDWPA
ncbi:MAG: ATP-binding cassette domain-containing protein, partial [Lachnospiraceae bacterium]|nr:ATP-binding cassette domain-containing protein [Lachnospiraceae bacterium]